VIDLVKDIMEFIHALAYLCVREGGEEEGAGKSQQGKQEAFHFVELLADEAL